MADKTKGGFTIIELILFVALSGLFLLIALAGMGGRSANIQFTDSMRSLSSYLQRQYSDTLNGVNSRDNTSGCQYQAGGAVIFNASEPGQSDCMVMGKAVVFNKDSNQAEVFVIVGRFLTQTADSTSLNYLDPSLSDEDLIIDAEPVILTSRLNQTYDIEWQTEFVDESGAEYDTIAFIRSPRSSSIYPITFRSYWTGDDPALDISNIGQSANYCFLGANGQDAEIIVSGSGRSDGVELVFDAGCS